MARKYLGPPGGGRRRKLLLLLPLAAIAALMFVLTASAGPIGSAAKFEDDDANLAIDNSANMDWNGFSPVSWTGTAPYQTASKTTSGLTPTTNNGWQFTGLTDAQASTSDSGFAGGIKQDVDCPALKNGKAPNKDDLKRIYIASKTISGHTYLMLAWERIGQNTVNASTHVGFEFNQGKTACGNGLVKRTKGDLLFVYDFEGSSAGAATLSVRKWVTGAGDACDISNDSAPCWGVAQDLTTAGFAEAKVNETSASDTLAPGGTDTLGQSEFGEAGADLTAAGIFQSGVCSAFGQVEGVSRSSGNSGQAAMEDLVGPGQINLTNCGEVKIIKHTDPAGNSKDFSFTSTLAGGQISCTTDTTPAAFTLNDGSSSTNTEDCTNVPIGNYTVTEGAEPSGYALESLTCTKTGSGTGSQDGTNPAQANIGIVAGNDTVTCTYVNQQQLGAIKITKTSSKAAATPLAGAKFSITKGGTAISGSPFTTDSNGVICVDNLAFGDYVVTETVAPDGYAKDDSTGHTVTVDNNAKCSDASYSGESIGFTDTPLTDITATATSEASGGTKSRITCVDSSNANVGDSPKPSSSTFGDPVTVTANGLAPGTYTCTIIVDP